jgi:hypothetical protein
LTDSFFCINQYQFLLSIESEAIMTRREAVIGLVDILIESVFFAAFAGVMWIYILPIIWHYILRGKPVFEMEHPFLILIGVIGVSLAMVICSGELGRVTWKKIRCLIMKPSSV